MITSEPERPRVSRMLAKRGLLAAGYYAARMRRVRFPGIAVLCYHGICDGDRSSLPFEALHVESERFEEQCAAIAAHCSPITLTEVLDAARHGRRLPPRPVLMTFDDGYRSVYTRALPVLAKYRIPATVFVTTGGVQNQELFWFDAAFSELGDSGVRRVHAGPIADWRSVMSRMRKPAAADPEMAPMSIEELKSLAAHPLIEIGAHTTSHVRLGAATVADQREEVTQSRAQLEAWLGISVRAFAYPYGAPDSDYSAETVSVVRDAGYQCAFTTAPAFASPAGDLWQLPRFVMLNGVEAAELLHRMAHSWHRTA